MEYRTGMFRDGAYTIIVSKDAGNWHLSISHPAKIPPYEVLKKARYRYLPNDVTMAQLFPPKEQFVNIHPYCLHLWEIPTEP